METIKHTRVRLIAVDEAHCISEWGQAFRPDYLKGSIQSSLVVTTLPVLTCVSVARFVKEIKAERVLCLTATVCIPAYPPGLFGYMVPIADWKSIKATPRVAADICAAFDIPQDGLFKTTTYRQKYVDDPWIIVSGDPLTHYRVVSNSLQSLSAHLRKKYPD